MICTTKISPNGVQFIKVNEGFVSKLYRDVANFETIGYGHKVLPTDSFPDTGITEDEATALLLKDLAHIEIFLNAAYDGLYQNEFDAMCDFGFNLGVGALHTMLGHGIENVANQILLWDHAAGKVVTGLLERRQRELDLWNKDDHGF